MTENDSTEEKSIAVDHLNFGVKTSKRVGWEAWEFSVAGPHQVEVTNASWGFQKEDHSYTVGIEERDGLLIPAECGCKADRFREDYDCKHKVALATVGGTLVLEAAVDHATPEVDTEGSDTSTLADRLRADGGAIHKESSEDSPSLYEAEPDECSCDDLPDDFPCADCYVEGQGELPV